MDWTKYTLEDWRRFFAKIEPQAEVSSPHVKTPCWLWVGAISNSGYGTFTFEGNTKRAHREAYKFCVGPIPKGHVLMHICDNPRCVNPIHHTTGTQADNLADASEKGRLTKSFRAGENNSNSKYTAEQVTKMKIAFAHGTSPSEIARKYKASLSTVKDICYGKTWTHIEIKTPKKKKDGKRNVQRKRTKEEAPQAARKFSKIRRKEE